MITGAAIFAVGVIFGAFVILLGSAMERRRDEE